MTTKQDWLDWKAHPITKTFFDSVLERREDIKEVLIVQAGREPVQDSELKGYAQALLDVTNTEFEEISEDA